MSGRSKVVRFSERESEKLLSKTNEDIGNKQKYAVSADSSSTPPHKSNATSSHSMSGDHLSSADTRSTTSKTTDVHQLKITEQEEVQPKPSTWKRKILKVTVTLMFLTMAIGIIVIWTLHEGGGLIIKEDGYFVFDTEEFNLKLERIQYKTVFEGQLGKKGIKYEKKDTCEDSQDKYCYKLEKGPILRLNMLKVDKVQCYTVHWENVTSAFIPNDCFDLKSGKWYGMMSTIEPSDSQWPLSDIHVAPTILHPGFNSYFGNVMDYYWLSSEGSSLYMIDSSPFKFSLNDQHNNALCISPSLLTHIGQVTSLQYVLCQGQNIKEVHQGISKKFRMHPPSYSNNSLLDTAQMVFSVSSQNTSIINQLNDSRRNVLLKNLTCGVLEVSQHWEQEMGDFMIKSEESPDLSSFYKTLAQTGCKLLFPIFPISSYKSKTFISGIEGNDFLKNPETGAIQIFQYRNTQGALWNIKDIKTKGKLFDTLQKLVLDTSVSMFRLSTLPNIEVDNSDLIGENGSSEMYRNWLELLYQVSPHSIWPVVHATFRSQDVQSVLEVQFKRINSSASICLSNSLPNALTLGLYGYPILMSSLDVSNDSNSAIMEPELLVRWLQISIFFPWIKIPYSLLKSNINTNSVLNLRHSVLTELDEIDIMDTLSVSTPLIQPMWWVAPSDPETYSISDQFLVGNTFLIAPVLCNGTRSRDIYLPKGSHSWRYNNQNIESGWHRNFPAPLEEVLLFRKISVPSKS